MLNMIEQRMAFNAILLNGNRLKSSPEDEREWRRDLPVAIEAQYTPLDRGELPAPMTLENVRRLKTLHVKNAIEQPTIRGTVARVRRTSGTLYAYASD